MPSSLQIAVTSDTPACLPQAEALAARLGLPLTDVAALLLTVTPERLELREAGTRTGPVFVDFVGGATGHRLRFGGGRGQTIARAVGLKGGANPSVLDATAGLGRDAFVLASLGCTVTLVERSPVVAALLEDGLRRAAEHPDTASIVARMRLLQGNAIAILSGLDDDARPEVVYLDPMFPPRGKAAQVKKEMRLFHTLVGKDEDAAELLTQALKVARKRVVVKRPRLAPAIDGPKPSMVIEGKTTRYDVYVMPKSDKDA